MSGGTRASLAGVMGAPAFAYRDGIVRSERGAKRRALIKAGLPASSLRIAYVKTRAGVGHAILVVKTSKGDYVLDNLNRSVRPLSQSGYRIISISGADPMKWS